MPDVDAYQLRPRSWIRIGDVVKVAPSRKGKRDGFLGTVRKIHVADPADVSLEVFGGPAGKAPAIRTIRLERISRTRKTAASLRSPSMKAS
jgi:hypothetical protein